MTEVQNVLAKLPHNPVSEVKQQNNLCKTSFKGNQEDSFVRSQNPVEDRNQIMYKAIQQQEKDRKDAKRKQNISLFTSVALTALIAVSVVLSIKQFSGMGMNTKALRKQLFTGNEDAIPLKDLYYSDEVMQMVDRVKESVKNPAKKLARGSHPIKRLLLTGPGGTGKTTLAKSITKEMDGVFAELNMATLDSEWKSVGLRNLNKAVDLFIKEARKNPKKPHVLFLDEADSILAIDKSINAEETNKLQNEFKKLLTKLEKEDNIVVIAATNANIVAEKTGAEALGEITIAGPLSSRFADAIKIDLPNSMQIRKKIASLFKKCSEVDDILKNENGDEVIKISDFLSDRSKTDNVDFREIISLADSADRGGSAKVSLVDFVEALKAKKTKFKFTGQEYNKLLDDLGIAKDAVKRLPDDIPQKTESVDNLAEMIGQIIGK